MGDPMGSRFPVIAVDSPLVACTLTEEGGINGVAVHEGEWLFFAQLPEYFGTCIRILSRKRLPSFAQEARAFASVIRQELQPESRNGVLAARPPPGRLTH